MAYVPDGAWRAGRFWWDSSRPGDGSTHPLRGVVFDLDSMTDVECGGHRLAFNAAFAAHGLPMTWSVVRYRKLLTLRDERQRVAAELRARGICTECDVLLEVLVDEVCATASMVVDETMLDADLDARTGLVDLITDAFTVGVPVAVTSSGRRRWVEPLVRQLLGDGLVHTVVTADDVAPAAPKDAALRMALAELGAPAHDSLMFTGSLDGLRTAMSVGLAGVLVDPEMVGVRADYAGLRITDCRRLHAEAWARGRSAAA